MKLLSSAVALALSVSISGYILHTSTQNSDESVPYGVNITAQQNLTKSYILQGSDAASLHQVVASVGGNVNREFPIINAVSAVLTSQQADKIRKLGDVRVQDDRSVMLMSAPSAQQLRVRARIEARKAAEEAKRLADQQVMVPSNVINNYIAQQVGADYLHLEGITGEGVTVAIIDSGVNVGGAIGDNLLRDIGGDIRVSYKYDATQTAFERRRNPEVIRSDDRNGHGTNVGSIIASTFNDDDGNFNGIAPDVNLISVRAFDAEGQSTYSIVLSSLDWVLQNKDLHNIRVVNMSLGAKPISYYWDDPVNQAVMKLWEAGIVVVSSAGNNGDDGGITVPGNNPYIITVGSASDNSTPFDFTDDRISTFSAKGPTHEGFIKPEIVAYGQGISTKMEGRFFPDTLRSNPKGIEYSEISGTSQAAALVTGVVALMISYDRDLTPDNVKCRIMATARTANDGENMTYSPFAQGAGLVNAYAAVKSTETDCANQGLNIAQDIAGINHFVGPARISEDGTVSIDLGNGQILVEGNHWNNGVLGTQGNHWGNGVLGTQGNHWNNGVLGTQGNHWGNGVLGVQGNHWNNGVLGVQGNHWNNGVLGVQGNPWANGVLGVQGNHWSNGVLGVQGAGINFDEFDIQGNPWANGVINTQGDN